MRTLKLLLTLALLGGVAWMWSARAWVSEAYTSEHESVDLQLDGLDLTAEVSTAEPSPFVIAPAPDTSDVVLVDEVAVPAVSNVGLNGGSTVFHGFVTEVVDGAVMPVTGAVVSIERITLDGSASAQLVTGADGSWRFSGLHGGSYRLRAYVPGVATSGAAAVRFVADGSDNEMQFGLTRPTQAVSLELFAPSEITTTGNATVAVVASTRTVDELGRFVEIPVPGLAITLTGSPAISIASLNQSATDNGGAARFLVSCATPGVHAVTAIAEQGSLEPGVEGQRVAVQFNLAPCVTPAPVEIAPIEPPAENAPADNPAAEDEDQ